VADSNLLFATYRDGVFRYLSRIVGAREAPDLTQEVFLRVSRSVVPQHSAEVQRAWVFRIARNRLIDLHRRRRRRGEVDLSATLASALESPQVLAERAIERGQLQIALKHLTDEQRQVIVLKFIEGFDNRSIGQIVGRSEGAIKSLQHRALGSLRRLLYREAV